MGIVAYRDDWRHAGDSGKGNLMLTESAEIVADTFREAVSYLREHYPVKRRETVEDSDCG